jgi:DNA-binding IclR family transcriptional regulator
VGPVLDLFTVTKPEWGLSEVAAALDIPKSTSHALLLSMTELGLLKRTTRARYRLGWRLLVLGRTAMLSAECRRPVALAMQRAADVWGETMHFAVYERGTVVNIHSVQGQNSIVLGARIGTRLPAHASAVGKMLLSHHGGVPDRPLPRLTANTIADPEELEHELAAIRHRGVAFDNEESVRRVSCVAGPVRCEGGGLVGALSFAVSSDRLARCRDAYVDEIVAICNEISRNLGATSW